MLPRTLRTMPPAIHRVARLSTLLLAVLVSTISCQAPPAVPEGSVTIGPADSGSTVRLKTGQDLLVELLANPAMGYRWELRTLPDQAVILPDGDRMIARQGAAPSEEVRTQQLRFVAQAPGRALVVLEYVQPGQPVPSDPASFTFIAEVTPK